MILYTEVLKTRKISYKGQMWKVQIRAGMTHGGKSYADFTCGSLIVLGEVLRVNDGQCSDEAIRFGLRAALQLKI